jgi:hypothetical protein
LGLASNSVFAEAAAVSDTNQRAGTTARNAAEQTRRTVEGAAERARQVGQGTAEAGAAMAGRASEGAQDLAREARDRGASLAGDAADRLQREAGERKDRAAERIDDVADALRRSGEGLEDHEAWLAGLVQRGAAELSSFAETLRTNDFRALLGRIESMAHEQPALFVGASMAAGFALARLGRVAASGAAPAPAAGTPAAPQEPIDTVPGNPAGGRPVP